MTSFPRSRFARTSSFAAEAGDTAYKGLKPVGLNKAAPSIFSSCVQTLSQAPWEKSGAVQEARQACLSRELHILSPGILTQGCVHVS